MMKFMAAKVNFFHDFKVIIYSFSSKIALDSKKEGVFHMDMDEKKLKDFQKQLIFMKNEIEKRWDNNDHFQLEKGLDHESTGELSSYDNHPGDDATELYEREKDLALNKHLEKEYEEIVEALERIHEGTYGTCSVCGKKIDEDRLKAIPTAKTCKEHTLVQTISHERPVEEEILDATFHGSSQIDHENTAVTEPYDYFQDVIEYGTSETPQDVRTPPLSYGDMYNSDDEIGYIEDIENFIYTDIEGKNVNVYPSHEHKRYEKMLDEEDLTVLWGDLPLTEKEPYTKND